MTRNFSFKKKFDEFMASSTNEKAKVLREYFINHLLYILLFAAIIGIALYDPRFLSLSSIVNIISPLK